MTKLFHYISYRIRKLQKSQRQAFLRAVWRACIIWLIATVLLMWVFWTSRVAGPENTVSVTINGNAVSLSDRVRGPSSIVFSGDYRYCAAWPRSAALNVRQATERLQQEESIVLLVLSEPIDLFSTRVVVDVRGETTHYLSIEDYNHNNAKLRWMFTPIVVTFSGFLSFIYIYPVVHYLKLDHIKYYKPEND